MRISLSNLVRLSCPTDPIPYTDSFHGGPIIPAPIRFEQIDDFPDIGNDVAPNRSLGRILKERVYAQKENNIHFRIAEEIVAEAAALNKHHECSKIGGWPTLIQADSERGEAPHSRNMFFNYARKKKPIGCMVTVVH